jgi:two-component system, NtrC family, sensor kinase
MARFDMATTDLAAVAPDGMTRGHGSTPSERRVLVIDDNVKIHDDVRKLLGPSRAPTARGALEAELFGAAMSTRDKRPHFDLDFADRGEDGAVLVRRSLELSAPYSVAFVDMRMPGWDGLRTATEIWAIDPRIQIVFCTAYSDYSWDEIATRLTASHAFLILKKPFDAIELRQLAHALSHKWLLERERELRETQLEDEVNLRTTELASANGHLRQEIERRGHIEKALRHAQKLEALGRLAAGIGHEINNPLSYVAGNIEFVRDGLGKGGETISAGEIDEMCEALDEASEGAERIRRIVGEIRTFSRATEAAAGSVDLGKSLEAALRMVGTATRHRARLTCTVPERQTVLADSHRLEQVFVNVLMNASQAFAPDKQASNEIRVDVRPSGSEVEVAFTDNGCGIDEADLEKVFDPFFTKRAHGQGTGLGLWICRTIIESFGGTIDIESKKGIGTTVRLRLRATDRATTASEASDRDGTRARTRRKARVLVVDDETAILRLVARTLAEHDVQTTTSGSEALALYEAGQHDLVLCDLMMPEMNGVEVYAAFAALGEEHARRVVFITGGAYAPEVSTLLERCAAPVLDKPLSAAKLLELVRDRLLERAVPETEEVA